jgi:hypothetical protein
MAAVALALTLACGKYGPPVRSAPPPPPAATPAPAPEPPGDFDEGDGS